MKNSCGFEPPFFRGSKATKITVRAHARSEYEWSNKTVLNWSSSSSLRLGSNGPWWLHRGPKSNSGLRIQACQFSVWKPYILGRARSAQYFETYPTFERMPSMPENSRGPCYTKEDPSRIGEWDHIKVRKHSDFLGPISRLKWPCRTPERVQADSRSDEEAHA